MDCKQSSIINLRVLHTSKANNSYLLIVQFLGCCLLYCLVVALVVLVVLVLPAVVVVVSQRCLVLVALIYRK